MLPARSTKCGGCCSCSRGFSTVILLLLISAIPLASIIALESRATSNPSTFEYHSFGWFRECAKWDSLHRRFLVSTFLEGGVSEVEVGKPKGGDGGELQEKLVLRDPDVAGNGSLGILVDRDRSRLMVTYVDVFGHRYGAVAAYDLATWRRLFLTQLSSPGDDESYPDDVAVDMEGNAYITDAKGNKLWKVGLNGELKSVIRSHSFKQRQEWYYNKIGLNGIVYHPNGYLLVIHTSSGCLFKVHNIAEQETAVVEVVKVSGGSLLMGDGLELISPTKLVVAGVAPSARLVESSDDWKTSSVTGRYFGPVHRIATSVTAVGDRVYLNHLVGGGLGKRTHVLAEAVFSSLP